MDERITINMPGSHHGKTVLVMPTYMRTYEDFNLTIKAIQDIGRTVPPEHTLLVVDDHSPNRDAVTDIHAYLGSDTFKPFWSLYQKAENTGFAKSVNVGLSMAKHNRMNALLVNADMEFPDPNWFKNMLAVQGSCVGGKLLYPNGLIQHAGVYFSLVTYTFDHLHKGGPADLDAANYPRYCPVTGALQFLSNECINAVGMYDETFKMGWEDVDYCLRVFLSGRRCIYSPDVVAVHHESVFRGNKSDKLNDWMRTSFYALYKKYEGLAFGQYVPMLIGRDPMDGKAMLL